MEKREVVVPVHDIHYKMDEIVNRLNSLKGIAVEPQAVQELIDHITAARRVMERAECCDYSCTFAVENQTNLRIAV